MMAGAGTAMAWWENGLRGTAERLRQQRLRGDLAWWQRFLLLLAEYGCASSMDS